MNYKFKRKYEDQIKKDFFQGKVIVLAGARQVGKTTLIEHILKEYENVVSFNADNPNDRIILEERDYELYFFGEYAASSDWLTIQCGTFPTVF